jgi:hypothetical protein
MVKVFDCLNTDFKTAEIQGSMIYRFLTETKAITKLEERVCVFELYKDLDYVFVRIIQHNNSTYRANEANIEVELDEYEKTLSDYLATNKYVNFFTCIPDFTPEQNITMMTKEEGDLNDIKQVKKEYTVDYILITSLMLPLADV